MTTETHESAQDSTSEPATELDTPQPESRDIAAPADPAEGGPHPADDSEELEHEGRKYRIPAAVRPLLMLQADYARRTQELAERARGLEGERESFALSAQAQRQILVDGREVAGLDWQIDQLRAIDFPALQQSDPNRAQQLFWQLTQLQGQRETKARALQQRIAERQTEAARELLRRRSQAQAALARDIDGWTPELEGKLAAFATGPDLGFTATEYAQVDDPRVMKLLHLAHLGQQAFQKLKAAGAPAAVQATPTRTVGSSSPANRSPDQMTTEEWMEHRKSQIRTRRK